MKKNNLLLMFVLFITTLALFNCDLVPEQEDGPEPIQADALSREQIVIQYFSTAIPERAIQNGAGVKITSGQENDSVKGSFYNTPSMINVLNINSINNFKCEVSFIPSVIIAGLQASVTLNSAVLDISITGKDWLGTIISKEFRGISVMRNKDESVPGYIRYTHIYNNSYVDFLSNTAYADISLKCTVTGTANAMLFGFIPISQSFTLILDNTFRSGV